MSIIDAYIKLTNEETIKKIAQQRTQDAKLSRGPSARFTGRITLGGAVHYYDVRTHTVDRLRGAANCRKVHTLKAKKQGWIVGETFNGNGYTGMYARYDMYVLRPKNRMELEQEAITRAERKRKLLAKKALPFNVRLLLAHSGYNRKGVIRTSTAWAERLIKGFIYNGEHCSPYGPRTRNMLTRLGVPVDKHNEVLSVFGFEI